MKSFNEWKTEETRDENPVLLVQNINKLSELLTAELQSYKGERFQGILEMIGACNSLRKTLAEIELDAFSPKWLTTDEACGDGKPESPHGMKKISFTEKKSKGSRDLRSDLSKDYKGHISHNGTVEPYQKVK